MEDLDHMFAVVVNLVIIIAALFGVEMLLYRSYIHELNSLISRISLLQAQRDLTEESDPDDTPLIAHSLEGCADLLGLISTVAGYYGEANSGLMFNGLTGSIHARANTLKLNIRIKLLHARTAWPQPGFVSA